MRRPILSVVVTLILCSLLVSSAETGGRKDVFFFAPFSDPLEIDILTNQIKAFEANNPDIRVYPDFVPGSHYNNKLQMMAVSGRVPDVFALDVFYGPLCREIAQPLDRFWQRDGDEFDPGLIEKFRFYKDGGLYGIPGSFNSLGLFYNRELLAERGLNAPENWNDLIEKVRKLTKRDLRRYGIAFGDATVSFLAFAIANGASPLKNINEALIDVGSDEAIRALEFYLELQRNFPSFPWVVGAEGVKQAFINGQAAMILEGSWSSRHIREMSPKLNYSVARLPSADAGGRGNLLFATVYSIANQTKVPEESWKLIKFLIGEESQKLWLESRIGLPLHKDVENLFPTEYSVNRAFYADMDVAKLYSFDRIGSLYIPEVERAIKRATMGQAPDEALGHAVKEIKNALGI